MKRLTFASMLIVVAVAFGAAAAPDDLSEARSAAAAGNRFALDLYGQLAAAEGISSSRPTAFTRPWP